MIVENYVADYHINKKGRERFLTIYKDKFNNPLKKLHNQILKKIEKFPSSKLSFAYKKNVSAKDALNAHMHSDYVIKTDITGFFKSITLKNFQRVVSESFKIEPELLDSFKNCFYKDSLPLGFVTSPKLSDMYMYGFDTKIEEYLKTHPDLAFSRYSDDMLISGNNADEVNDLFNYIESELHKLGFELNTKKTFFRKLTDKAGIRFLGINLTKDPKNNINKITVSKNYILLTLNIYRKYLYALKRIPELTGQEKEEKINYVIKITSVLLGRISYLKSISKNSYERFLKKFANNYDHKLTSKKNNYVYRVIMREQNNLPL